MENYLKAKGELLPYERYTLYHWIKEIIPLCILEVGTGSGGATSSMAAAIKESGFPSIIHTCDPYGGPSSNFFKQYSFVKYYCVRSDDLIENLITRNINIDFVMFDGPEDPAVALDNILILEKYIRNDTYFCMHDWEILKRGHDNSVATKAQKIRPYIERSEKWVEIEVLSGLKKNSEYDGNLFDSVGLCLYKFDNNKK